MDSLDEVSEKATRICEKAFAPIAATTGTRLAVNGQFLLTKMGAETKKAFISRFLIQPEVYKGKTLTEWNVRYNSLTDINTSEHSSEKCNYIINIGDIIAVDTQTGTSELRTAVGIDINTSPDNMENKYSVKDLLYFSIEASAKISAALTEIEGV